MERIHEWIKKMVGRQMGRYWSTEEKRKISTLWKTEGKQESLSKMRPTCKSHTDDKWTKGELLSNENEQYLILDLNQLTLQHFLNEIEKQLEE